MGVRVSRILTAEMTWLRKILHVTRRDRIKNIDITETLQQKETMVDNTRRRRLTWFSHVSRMDERRLPSSIGQCTVILKEEGREEAHQRNG